MAIKIPTRNYLTFRELQERWQCAENDLKFAIISSELKPSVRLIGSHLCLAWEQSAYGGWETIDYSPGDFGYGLEIEPRGWQYLQDPVQSAPFDCQFRLVSDDRNPEKSETPFSNWHALPSAMTLDDVKDAGVFLLKEVAMYEAKHGDGSDIVKEEKPLATRERDTLLTIIAALCKEAKIDYTKPAKAAGLIQSTAALMRVSIGETTIEGHLKKIPDALATRMK